MAIGDDRKSNTGRESSGYVTIPPELRAFVPAKGDAAATAAKVGTPELAAAAAELRELNGGENADPFFFDTRGVAKVVERDEGEEPKGVGNAKVHVPAFALPSAKSATGAVVDVAADDAEITVEKAPAVAVEKAASPWASDAAAPLIALSDLPSALAPVARTEPAPKSEKLPSELPQRDGLVRVLVVVAVIAVLGLAAFQLIPREKTKDPVAAVPVASGTASAAPAAAGPGVSATAPSAAVPVNTVEIDAGAPPVPGTAAAVVPVKVKSSGGADENIYDAAAPSPAKTVEAVVVPPPPPSTVPVVPPKPPATATATAPDEEIFSRPKKKPEEGAKSK